MLHALSSALREAERNTGRNGGDQEEEAKVTTEQSAADTRRSTQESFMAQLDRMKSARTAMGAQASALELEVALLGLKRAKEAEEAAAVAAATDAASATVVAASAAGTPAAESAAAGGPSTRSRRRKPITIVADAHTGDDDGDEAKEDSGRGRDTDPATLAIVPHPTMLPPPPPAPHAPRSPRTAPAPSLTSRRVPAARSPPARLPGSRERTSLRVRRRSSSPPPPAAYTPMIDAGEGYAGSRSTAPRPNTQYAAAAATLPASSTSTGGGGASSGGDATDIPFDAAAAAAAERRAQRGFASHAEMTRAHDVAVRAAATRARGRSVAADAADRARRVSHLVTAEVADLEQRRRAQEESQRVEAERRDAEHQSHMQRLRQEREANEERRRGAEAKRMEELEAVRVHNERVEAQALEEVIAERGADATRDPWVSSTVAMAAIRHGVKLRKTKFGEHIYGGATDAAKAVAAASTESVEDALARAEQQRRDVARLLNDVDNEGRRHAILVARVAKLTRERDAVRAECKGLVSQLAELGSAVAAADERVEELKNGATAGLAADDASSSSLSSSSDDAAAKKKSAAVATMPTPYSAVEVIAATVAREEAHEAFAEANARVNVSRSRARELSADILDALTAARAQAATRDTAAKRLHNTCVRLALAADSVSARVVAQAEEAGSGAAASAASGAGRSTAAAGAGAEDEPDSVEARTRELAITAAQTQAALEQGTAAIEAGVAKAATFEPRANAAGECVVCMMESATAIMAPCGHKCACEACAETCHARLGRCPICREAIRCVVKRTFEMA